MGISASTFATDALLQGTPELLHVSFDMRRLEVNALFKDPREKLATISAYCSFAACAGFRVLDEGDLLDFWMDEKGLEGWLWQIHFGGWLDQEMARDGFFSSRPAGPNWPAPKEYLVIGEEFCVSVLTASTPHIWIADA